MKSICETCRNIPCWDYDTRGDKECMDYDRMSNTDCIRTMTDEELAEWAAKLPCCPPGTDLEELCYPSDSCENTEYKTKCWLNWLKQEVTDESI